MVGSHNADEFYKYDVKIVSKKKVYDVNGNEVKGVTEVEYNMPELDMAGNPKGPGIYGTKVHRKTIYDPKLMSDKEFVEKGMEAANDALSKESSGVIPREWIGIDSNGVKWNGYFENGKITSFFPTN
ncbi:CdiA family toxin C-terminal domain-containing protein [Bacillus sp. FJAT-51639]|uniref:CdiA family toxin C-terminal domain-containing protein n=1 Tax=Bacillus bruguierae TaxID=3127667 RepID=A0ABU8FPJ1_9BACI